MSAAEPKRQEFIRKLNQVPAEHIEKCDDSAHRIF